MFNAVAYILLKADLKPVSMMPLRKEVPVSCDDAQMKCSLGSSDRIFRFEGTRARRNDEIRVRRLANREAAIMRRQNERMLEDMRREGEERNEQRRRIEEREAARGGREGEDAMEVEEEEQLLGGDEGRVDISKFEEEWTLVL